MLSLFPSTETPSRGRRIGLIVLLVLLTLLFLLVSVTKIYPAEFMATNMGELHYGRPSVFIIGLLELAAAVGLWIPRYRTLALSVLLLIMAGSAGSHWGFGHPAAEVVPSFIVATLVFAALWLDRGRALWAFVLRK